MSDVDDLFQLPLSEFTAARNALADRLKKAGRADDAARVKALAKPPVSAWAVNQLYWRDRKAFDRLLDAGEQLRRAQASQLRGRGGELREPIEARRIALSDLSKRAAALLTDAGHAPSPDLMRRITTTLEALATYGREAAAPAAGRLTGDVDAPGFEALAALVPRKERPGRGGAAPRVIPFVQKSARRARDEKLSPAERKRREAAERKAQQAAAKTALRAAERALGDARKTAARAETALKAAAARAKEAEKTRDALTARYEKATADADSARQHARRIASQAEEAAQAVADAERALEEAKRRLKELTD